MASDEVHYPTPTNGESAPEGTRFLRVLGVGSTSLALLVDSNGIELVCKRPVSNDPVARASHLRERRVLASIDHPAIPGAVAVGRDGVGPYILHRPPQGNCLRLIAAASNRESTTMAAAASRLWLGLLRTLNEVRAHASTVGMVDFRHGDLTPEHIFVGQGGAMSWIDFGQSSWDGADLTGLSRARGTAPFAPPEVVRGQRPATRDDDVFGLAASVAASLGAANFWHDAPAGGRLARFAQEGWPPYWPPEAVIIGEPLRAALLSALATDPAIRQTDPVRLVSQ